MEGFGYDSFAPEYLKYSVLYDKGDPDYMDKSKKSVALKQLGESFTPSIPEKRLKSKIKGLRSAFGNLQRRVADSKRSGASGKTYKPKAKWYAEMEAVLGRNKQNSREITCSVVSIKTILLKV